MVGCFWQRVTMLACRAGVGSLTLVDGDVVDSSNANRQLPALISTVGKRKVSALERHYCNSFACCSLV
jgi:tRNA A37 threonylcarbamoyladenosine dehydratase